MRRSLLAINTVGVLTALAMTHPWGWAGEPAFRALPRYIGPPKPLHAVANRAFQGIPSMAVTPAGRIWATWYAGKTPGEDHNNYVVLSTSGDDGKSWKEVLVVDPDEGGPVRAYDPELWMGPDGKLRLVWAQTIGHEGTIAGVWFLGFADPEPERPQHDKPVRVTDGIMMCKPLVLSSGEWVLPASTWRKTDNSARMVVSNDQGKTWTIRGACNVPVKDRAFDEHMFIERKDRSLWLLARTRYGIGESVSVDRGTTWPQLKPSSIAHPSARFFITRLNSGNLLLVKHGPISERTGRSHLTAFVSTDDGATWSGGLLLDERNGVSYPDGQQTADGRIRIIYDYSRTGERHILMATFREEDVAEGRPVSRAVRLRQLVSDVSGDAQAARETLERATKFLRSISTNGGYVGIYSPDLKKRYGEAVYEKASSTQIWVQPPGTPSVGAMFLRAYRVTGDQQYLDAARDVGRALAWGQRLQGGWDHRVDVAHLAVDAKKPVRKSGHCTFDDDISQGAIKFLMQLDEVLDEPWLDDSTELALQFMMESQFENGAWPQWYPLRGGYHDYYTYNDNTINDCIRVMLEAHRRYDEPVYLQSARRGGDFIIASQMPSPQAGWAQQYSHDLQPARARSFEPPGICSAATARNIRTLVDLYLYTGDEKYLGPIPDAISWLRQSTLPREAIAEDEVGGSVAGGVEFWARLYEVATNKPVYGDRENPRKIIYDIRQVSQKERSSYGWQGGFGIPGAIDYYESVQRQGREEILRQRDQRMSAAARETKLRSKEPQVRQIVASIDDQGRWITDGMLRIGTFVSNMNVICEYLECTSAE